MPIKTWMIYGANGYTGELIARAAKARNLSPVIAGRNQDTIPALARELGLQSKIFRLDMPSEIIDALAGIDLVLHCAGPFSRTSAPMVQACLAAKTHYLDITGELEVFEHIRQQNIQAKQRHIMMMPGVGFDVVPTDCLALNLKKYLPDANELTLAFDASGGISKGTARTVVESLRVGGRVRENGMIKAVPFGYKIREIPFVHKRKLAVTIPWGDISTAFHTTTIPNIEVYASLSPAQIKAMKFLRILKGLLSTPFAQNFFKVRIERKHHNPQPADRASSRSYVWGEVRNAQGDTRQAHLVLPNSYDLTVEAALGVVQYFLKCEPTPGVHTPAGLLGEHFVRTLQGVEMRM